MNRPPFTNGCARSAHMTRASIHLQGSGAIRGLTGDLIQPRLELWTGMLPPQ
jgi:hypothetical protein